ncbi:hypothetical protein [Demequina sp. B12]|uniref:hypothetical protein n=1 Tax=Demequina sp. B12 TaxID=2992757 RepID=UPI0031581BD5
MRIGERLDSQLSKSAMGSRIRRTRDGAPNEFSNGTYVPYLGPYREWNKAGLNAMRASLVARQDVIAITADASSYFHSLEPDFLLENDFRSRTELDQLSPEDEHLHRLFVSSLRGWQTAIRSVLGVQATGLPVGLPVSAIVANVALIDLDRVIENEVRPLHYGRYVDDIILVLRNTGDLPTAREVWEWISRRSDTLLQVRDIDSKDSPEGFEVRFKKSYLGDSTPTFSNEKNRVYFLSGATGLTLVDALQRTTSERASEWRQLPRFPDDPEDMTTDVVHALQADGDRAANLRTTDELTSSRAAFAITLRDVESLEADVDPATWSGHRRAFFEAVHDHIMVPTQFFKLASYYPRIIKLAAAVGEYGVIARLTARLADLCTALENDATATVAGAKDADPSETWRLWRSHLAYESREALCAGAQIAINDEALKSINFALRELDSASHVKLSAEGLITSHALLVNRDLAHRAFRSDIGNFSRDVYGVVQPRSAVDPGGDVYRILPPKFWKGLEAQARLMGASPGVPVAFAFPTRPVNLLELYAFADEFGSGLSVEDARSAVIASIITARGYSVDDSLPRFVHESAPDGSQCSDSSTCTRRCSHDVLFVPSERRDGRRSIAVGMVATSPQSWIASVALPPNRSLVRYQQLVDVINQTMSVRGKVDYLVLPELSVPRDWFIRFALKLRAKGTSLIAGIEYLHTGPHEVRNQAWAALAIEGLGFPATYLLRHNKQRPAPGEERRLWDTARKIVAPPIPPVRSRVIDHGGFRFGLLVCSELTNIEYRAQLRGAVDALFVPEWNQDLHTFEALVESAALDIHAYIIQSNDRAFGDSRIRAPMREQHLRDMLRVRGGQHNYVVVTQIDFWSLRSFQSAHRVQKGIFKPTPDGFVVSPARRRMPPPGVEATE